MRIRSLSATALAAAAAFQGAGAQDSSSVQATTSVITTYTLTRTVERVVATVTAIESSNIMTALSTTSIMTLASASLTLTPYVNGTASVLGTGTGPSSTAQLVMASSGAVANHGLDVLGYAAIVGVLGLVAA